MCEKFDVIGFPFLLFSSFVILNVDESLFKVSIDELFVLIKSILLIFLFN